MTHWPELLRPSTLAAIVADLDSAIEGGEVDDIGAPSVTSLRDMAYDELVANCGDPEATRLVRDERKSL